MPAEEYLSVLLSEIKGLRIALKESITRFEHDVREIYTKLNELIIKITRFESSIETVDELNEWKKEIQKMLSLDDFKALKTEREDSKTFRTKIYAYSAAIALVITLLWQVASIFIEKALK